MADRERCPDCGSELPANAPGAFARPACCGRDWRAVDADRVPDGRAAVGDPWMGRPSRPPTSRSPAPRPLRRNHRHVPS